MIKIIEIPKGSEIILKSDTQIVIKSKTEYVDLGLPSGTKWAKRPEEEFYSYNKAKLHFPNLPKRWQFAELIDECKWKWENNGYKIIGPNGNTIFLPAAGYRNCDGSMSNVGSWGGYWSSTLDSSACAWRLHFGPGGVCMSNDYRYYDRSVCLVSK